MDPTQPTPGPGGLPAPPPRKRSWPRRHPVKTTLIAVAVLAAAFITLGALTASGQPSTPGTVALPTPTHSPAPAPTPVPSEDGTFTGSCDYELGSDPVGGTAQAIGEVDVANTGNVATVVAVRITWPQEGYPPLTMRQHVRVPVGASVPDRFHRPLSYTEITRLQSWQTNHAEADGCTYDGTILRHYGPVHSRPRT
jgi:hypothetical protein